MNKKSDFPNVTVEDLEEPVTYGVEAFLSKDYLEEEKEKLWPRVWQMACRTEDIPNVGDYSTYNVAGESIIIVRTAPDTLKAFYNVCAHRARQLIDTPEDRNDLRGNRKSFVCRFHGWTYDLDGKNTYIRDEQDWKGVLTPEMTCLSDLKVDMWGGWVFINMDPECEPLSEFMGDAARILNAFELDKMRYKWRQWAVYNCNWKTAIEAFMEPYHVAGTHTQLLKYGDFYAY